jgi:hypothetical protein
MRADPLPQASRPILAGCEFAGWRQHEIWTPWKGSPPADRRSRNLLKAAGIKAGFFAMFGYPGKPGKTSRPQCDSQGYHTRPSVSAVSFAWQQILRISESTGTQTNWEDSNDLAMMFRPYQSPLSNCWSSPGTGITLSLAALAGHPRRTWLRLQTV